MDRQLHNFTSFIAENKLFFTKVKPRILESFVDLVKKTNKNSNLVIIEEFYDALFLDIKKQNFELFSEISEFSNINLILNRIFLLIANSYIKFILKDENSVEKLAKLTKLCDFYITYLNQYTKNSFKSNNTIPNEIVDYFASNKAIIYLTVFKGVPISSKTYINAINKEKGEIEVKINSYQIISAKFQNQVYIVNPDTGKTFTCNIKNSIQNEKLVILYNFNSIKRNNIKRNYIRVQPRKKVLINLEYKNSVFNGEVYDISLRGIAIISKPIKIDISDKVKLDLEFNCANTIVDIKTPAELISITKIDDSTYKYHFYFELQLKDEQTLEKYISNREKEIISELNQYIKNTLF